MFRNRILLASLLKPVTDTRMYEKMGRSLLKLSQAEIHIAGFYAPLPTETADRLSLHPIFKFKRLSIHRILAQWKYWMLLQNLKPDLIIIGTHELLLTSLFYSLRTGCKLIYDIQENYALNLSTQGIYRNGLGNVMAKVVSYIEKLTAPRIQHFFLAEQSYAQELPFLDQRFSILPNKYLAPKSSEKVFKGFPISLSADKPIKLLYSGTISRIYGTLEAVTFTEQLKRLLPTVELVIIGYCAEAAYLEELKKRIKPLSYINLIGGDHLVPHAQIIEQEQQCHIGLLPYQPHPSTFSCIPTKLYEYLANGLIVITQENPLWESILHETDGGIAFNFQSSVTKDVSETLINQYFYKKGIPKSILWEDEEAHLLSVVQDIL